MDAILEISLFIFIGLIMGGVFAWLMLKIGKQQIINLYLFATGILIGVVGFMLIPDALSHYSIPGLMIGTLAGLCFMMCLDEYVVKIIKRKQIHPRFVSGSLFLVLGIIFHTLPAGITIGTELTGSSWEMNSLVGTFLLHQIPEGMALFVSFLAWTDSLTPFFFAALLVALSLFLSILIGNYALAFTYKTKSITMGLAIGTLSFASVHSIYLQQVKKQRKFVHILLGVMFVLLYMMVFLEHGIR
ncbi:ZIP family metal transporter [Virgibacillus salexigens]|uniref:ZIP Zinc transporter n=2 Tax=Virgibacillus TaxID=84406 RepID=A0A024QEW6_9BACI|nr:MULTISPECIES: ZIP family metal transporter [Virgibacillus]MYL42590.1 hypothetical protein [Virgibacillus massiliensis]GGJ73861.1 zinc uptake transporter [Virgibacillus kapii]CDQ40471.1 ZIP Zinc transporter [Virgibacillus massiliensis]